MEGYEYLHIQCENRHDLEKLEATLIFTYRDSCVYIYIYSLISTISLDIDMIYLDSY